MRQYTKAELEFVREYLYGDMLHFEGEAKTRAIIADIDYQLQEIELIESGEGKVA